MNAISTPINRRPSMVARSMRSPRGFWGAILVLAMIPLTLLYQTFFAFGAATVTHWTLAAGATLISLAVFDFDKLPKWLTWIGSLSAAGLAIIFFLQGLSDLVPNEALANLAYEILGRYAESWLVSVFVLVWGGALLILDSVGKTKIFGFVALSLYIIEELSRIGLAFLGTAPNGYMKLLLLLPIVWLLFESMKAAQSGNRSGL